MKYDSSENPIVIKDTEHQLDEDVLVESSLGIDIPFQDGFSTEDSVGQKEERLETLKEKHRHEESKKMIDMAAALLAIALILLVIIWFTAIWLSPRQQDFSQIFVEILKTVVLTTIGFICGNKIDK